jgi:hypothetical protein
MGWPVLRRTAGASYMSKLKDKTAKADKERKEREREQRIQPLDIGKGRK